MQVDEITQKAVFWIVWRPKDSVAPAGSAETAKARWSLPPEHPSCDQQKAKSCSAAIPVGKWGKAFCINCPGGKCVTAFCCGVGKGIALLGMCELQGHALLGYKSQRLQPPKSHFGRGLGSSFNDNFTPNFQKHFQKYFRCQIACWNC